MQHQSWQSCYMGNKIAVESQRPMPLLASGIGEIVYILKCIYTEKQIVYTVCNCSCHSHAFSHDITAIHESTNEDFKFYTSSTRGRQLRRALAVCTSLFRCVLANSYIIRHTLCYPAPYTRTVHSIDIQTEIGTAVPCIYCYCGVYFFTLSMKVVYIDKDCVAWSGGKEVSKACCYTSPCNDAPRVFALLSKLWNILAALVALNVYLFFIVAFPYCFPYFWTFRLFFFIHQ